jgi:probable HAF family extracellular repeat protein
MTASGDGRYIAGTGRYVIPGVTQGSHAFRWDDTGTGIDLGTLGGAYSAAYGISDDGMVVVGAADRTGDILKNRAFRWEGGTMTDLGSLATDGTSIARGVSGDGQVVVGNSGDKAFRWDTTSTTMTDLGTLGGKSDAFATNRDGSVIVGQSTGTTHAHAVIWDSTNTIIDLGTLGGNSSSASDVSADGSVVVGWADGASGTEAFRWTDATGMRGLGVLSGQTASAATGVSDDGKTIVGNSGDRGFIWTMPAGGIDGIMQDIAYLQTSLVHSAITVNHLVTSQNRRLRDMSQQQCLPGATQTWCLGLNGNGYSGEATSSSKQLDAHFSAGLRINEQISVGANLGVGRADLNEQSAEQNSAFAIGLWGAYQQNPDNLGWGANASVASGNSDNTLERGTGLADVQRARIDMDINATALRVAGNYGIKVGTTLVTPEVALSHVRSEQDGFTERNVAFPLTISSSKSHESYATVAVRSATPVNPKGTLELSVALDAYLNEDVPAIEGRSAVPGLSEFHLDTSLGKRRVVPTAAVGYSHALNANSTVGGGVQMTTSTYEGQRPVMGVGVQYRYAF